MINQKTTLPITDIVLDETIYPRAGIDQKRVALFAEKHRDWRSFQRKPAFDKNPEDAILIDDYHNLLSKTGWHRTHHIQAPLSSERFEAGVVAAMQQKRILGVTSRYIIVTKQN